MNIVVGKKYRIKTWTYRPMGWNDSGLMDHFRGKVCTISSRRGTDLYRVEGEPWLFESSDFEEVDTSPKIYPVSEFLDSLNKRR